MALFSARVLWDAIEDRDFVYYNWCNLTLPISGTVVFLLRNFICAYWFKHINGPSS